MKYGKDEKKVFDRLINVLTEHNLRQSQDYIIEHYNQGCFYIRFCSKKTFVLDVDYFYERIPDIIIFKIKHGSDGIMFLNIKIRIRK